MSQPDPPLQEQTGQTPDSNHLPGNGSFRKTSLSRLAVVIPTHNNELTIGSLVLLAHPYAGHVIVVDDASLDRTVDIAQNAGADVIPAGYTGGRVNAILTGCKHALGFDCSAVVFLDITSGHLIRDIPRLAAPVLAGEADLVIGSRYLMGRKGIPPYLFDKPGNNHTLPDTCHVFYNSDPGSPFRALSVRAVCLLDLLPDSDQFEPAMVTLFARKGLALQEIPVKPRVELSSAVGDDTPRYRYKLIGVVVPAYNEELLIGDTLAGIPEFVARIYVVNDSSTDRTQQVLDYYAKHDTSIVPIRHEVNRGVGAAIVTGYTQALEEGMDIIGVMAGDNQMDPAFLTELLDPIIDRKCDYTMGNRIANPLYRAGMSTWRFIGNSILTMLTKIASGYWQMMDPQNGYTAISSRALNQISLAKVYPRYGYCNDILVKLNVESFRIINVPHPSRYGLAKSGIKYSTYIVNVSFLLLRDFLWRLKKKYIVLNFHPLVFFYVGGTLLTLLGLFGGLYALHYKFIQHQPIFIPGIASLIAFSLGLQTVFFAMFFDMQQEKSTNVWY
ncbi:MAG TPA: glycosyltransferase family 2 protein [Methanoregula sp.]|nr:glycosyltransferase family 2 protein [Methanoregula sp.]